jgi:hypothetical protein
MQVKVFEGLQHHFAHSSTTLFLSLVELIEVTARVENHLPPVTFSLSLRTYSKLHGAKLDGAPEESKNRKEQHAGPPRTPKNR